MSVLELDRVSVTYPGATVPSLRDVSLVVQPGEFVVVAGGTGSGKSTLLGIASGLVPHVHGGTFAGVGTVAGMDTREHGPAELARACGTLFQEPETQVVMGTVRAELGFPLENAGHDGPAVARGVEEAALALGIAGLLDRSTHELSGGELQRVALGAALATRPALVLLDEPTSQLDPVAGDELLGVLRRLNEEWGTAVLLAEHRLERCLGAADRVLALRDGALVCDAAPGDFLSWAAAEAPTLQTPGARLFSLAGLEPLPVAVKDARATLGMGMGPKGGDWSSTRPSAAFSSVTDLRGGHRGDHGDRGDDGTPRGIRGALARRRDERVARAAAALDVADVWVEPKGAPARLRGASLTVAPGEVVALMGANGAGKSTLLRIAAGLEDPTRGSVRAAGRVALLLQSPGDYFMHGRVGDELPEDVLLGAGLAHLADRHPGDLSGGERQRLALALVLQPPPGEGAPAALLLDEPTRGMDAASKASLANTLCALTAEGTAVVLATHDAELAVQIAARVILLGGGRVLADAPTADVLGGGWYFATQTARILGGAALTPEAGAELLRAHRPAAGAGAPDPDAAIAPRQQEARA